MNWRSAIEYSVGTVMGVDLFALFLAAIALSAEGEPPNSVYWAAATLIMVLVVAMFIEGGLQR